MQGILLVNTGSPKSKNRKDVKAFVGDMLSDPLLMTVPDWFRPILVKGMILPLRQFQSTAKYSLIWDDERNISPLLHHAKRLAEKLEERTGMPAEVAMRYQEPSVDDALQRFVDRGTHIHEVLVLPMFPQYAESSYKTAVDEIMARFIKKPYPFRLKFVEPYFNHPSYIQSLCKSLKPFIEQPYDELVFNFHSLPLSHVDKGWRKGKEFDYVYQLKETVLQVVKELNLNVRKYRIVYSSAIGSKWLEPSLDDTMIELADEGLKKIIVISPGFAADNLETLYDIKIKAKEIFFKHGGSQLSYVPCLNSEDHWVDGIIRIIS